jgi:hypothetical protein
MFVVLARGLDVLGIRNVFMSSRRLLYGKECWRLGGDKLRSYWFKEYEVIAVPFICCTVISLTYEENDGKTEIGMATGASNRVSCGGQPRLFRGLSFTYFEVLLYAISESADLRAIALLLSVFPGTFAELRKETVSFVMSVCPSAWNNSAPTGRIFMKLKFFENLSRKLKLH